MRALIVLVDVQIEALAADALGGFHQQLPGLQALRLRRHHDLVEIAGARRYRDEAGELVRRQREFGEDDARVELQIGPVLAEPVDALGEIDIRIGLLPAALPERGRGLFVGGLIGPQPEHPLRHAALPVTVPVAGGLLPLGQF